jgi:outer membrane protein assembly factor BamB
MGSTGLLNCLDGATGTRLWQRDVMRDTSLKNSDWGKACSPLVLDGLVVVTGGAERGPTLVAYHAASGELAWKANDRPTAKESYSSPMIVELAGVRQIVMLNDNTICGYDPVTGRQLWEHAWPGPEPKVTQPLVIGTDRLLVGSGYGVGCALLEVAAGENGALKVNEVWANRQLEPKFTNVVHRDGFLYGLDEAILVCLDLETGKRRWKKGRYGHGQILLVDDVIVVLAENGEAVLVEATPEAHRELSRFPVLEGKTWGHPVLVPPYLLVRNDHEAACYELRCE